MRMRNKKHAAERIEAQSSMLLKDISEMKSVSMPHIEIGCGKGGFISELAKRNPDINYIAIEKNTNVMVLAMEKTAAKGTRNVKFLLGDATSLEQLGDIAFCGRIYLNFSDPWPKKKQHKRRLTSPQFLELYKKILLPEGEIHLKTDNRGLFEYSIETLSQNGFKLKEVSLDLHASDFKDNVMTEYETRFSEAGMPIYRLVAYRS